MKLFWLILFLSAFALYSCTPSRAALSCKDITSTIVKGMKPAEVEGKIGRPPQTMSGRLGTTWIFPCDNSKSEVTVTFVKGEVYEVVTFYH